MSKPEELSISELRRRRQQGGSPTGAAAGRAPTPVSPIVDVGESPSINPVQPDPPRAGGDFKRFAKVVRERWGWVAVVAVTCAVAGLVIGYLTSGFSASVTLVQRDTGAITGQKGGDDSFQPRQFSAATMIQLMVAPELVRRVAPLAVPAVSEAILANSVRVTSEPDRELVTLTLRGSNPPDLVSLLNTYARQAVALTREIQLEDSSRLILFLQSKLSESEAELQKVSSEMEAFQVTERMTDPEAQTKALIGQLGEVMARVESARMEAELLELRQASSQRGDQAHQNVVLDRLKQARERLSEKLTRLTEAHPEVVMLQAEIAELERQFTGGSAAGTNLTGSGVASLVNVQLVELKARKAALANEVKQQEDLRDSLQRRITGLTQQGLKFQLIKARRDSLLRNRQFLADRRQAAQLYHENAAGYYRVLAEATLSDVSNRARYGSAVSGLFAGFLLGLAGCVAGICLVEARNDRIRTEDDLRRVTGLPVLASLGNLSKMTADEKDLWGFRTWTLINGKLDRTPDRGLVCGIISAREGEGKSTWIDLLVAAARRRGLKVLKVTGRTSKDQKPGTAEPADDGQKDKSNRPNADQERTSPQPSTFDFQPSSTTDVALPVPNADVCLDYVWNLDHRRQWQVALERWKGIENVVILVELPAASLPESLLLAETVPQLIWLSESGKARQRETRMHLETLKHARCQLVGSVLNKLPGSQQNV